MIKTQNNITMAIVFLLGMLLSFNLFYQNNTSSAALRYTSENTMATHDFIEDCEMCEDEQVTHTMHVASFFKASILALCFEQTGPYSQVHVCIWQPPKIS